MKYLLILLLSGCASTPAITEKTVSLDPRVLELCEPLLTLQAGATFEDLMQTTIRNFELYHECADRQALSVKLLKQFSNKE